MGSREFLSVDARIIERNIVARGCSRCEDLDTETEIGFMAPDGEFPFTISRPLQDGVYTQSQVDLIEKFLARFEIELLPLDPNL